MRVLGQAFPKCPTFWGRDNIIHVSYYFANSFVITLLPKGGEKALLLCIELCVGFKSLGVVAYFTHSTSTLKKLNKNLQTI